MKKKMLLFIGWMAMVFVMSGCSFTLIEQTSARAVPYYSSCGSYYGYYSCGGCSNCDSCNCYISDW